MKTKLYIKWGTILLQMAPAQPLPDRTIFKSRKKSYQLLKAPKAPNN